MSPARARPAASQTLPIPAASVATTISMNVMKGAETPAKGVPHFFSCGDLSNRQPDRALVRGRQPRCEALDAIAGDWTPIVAAGVSVTAHVTKAPNPSAAATI